MGKPRSVSPTIFLLVILLVTAGEKTEAKPWWKKVGDSIGNIAGGIRNAVGNYKPVEMGLSLKGGFCVRKLLSLNTNVFSEWCIALNDPRAPMYMKIENIPSGVSIESILKKPIDLIKNHYPNFLKVWNFNQKIKRKPRRAL
ncbi:hypothetical protein AtNW77_Chr1g0000331 [Arabidopsis thaliana]|uniref:Uncharacterized protein n=4 Tax=Arabidopsis TaxID=3701 RepID=Q1G401_ARATH|nr:uncharacterized protein AT1G01305 [Arabidopsis thaliana]KAG7644672.1 hypothetical protein ISN45_At01g000380 [Arabidopsis thaliana x Arabidopsis arenosa]ABF59290.1 unknown protein [Arabidopsis thaliana]AEE27269.1 hypothetical protein AT1G01305 [Arabidopsis thaliana]OAP14701.1 hypothetical protein AXX17_AT1G00350 [Arabidopsis thaliana]CAA0153417.1 unnamed protein product [Arabidopsis thaliana]|eukprot:NP_001117205.1 hypothetical protein AT1G01305 [Arabidopsis thaliana]